MFSPNGPTVNPTQAQQQQISHIQSRSTGGPAFPVASYQGLTMRDYFAAKAMAVIMPSVVAELQKRSYSEDKVQQLRDAAAGACYGMADAMLKARTE